MNHARYNVRSGRSVAIMAGVLAVSAGVAYGQERPASSPQNDPLLTSPSVEKSAGTPQRPRPDMGPVAPVANKPPMAALPSLVAGADQAGLIRTAMWAEGSVVSGVTGTLLKSGGGDLILIAEDGRAMGLQPCATLSQVERSGAEGAKVRIGGIAHSYRGMQFILPTSVAAVRAEATPPVEPTPQSATPAATPAAVTPSGAGAGTENPSVADLIKQLDSRPSLPRTVEPVRPVAAQDDATPKTQAQVAPDGTVLISRRARLSRQAGHGGRLAATVDNDPDAPGEGLLLILPCKMLERAEAMVGLYGEEAAYRVSGRIMTYEGHQFLLPVLIQAERSSEVIPAQ